MTNIEMNASAALYLGSDWKDAQREGARVFPSAAKAVRFAMEEVPPVSLRGALMVVDGQPFSPGDIADIYRSPIYPFAHKVTRKYRPSRTARRLERA